MKSCPICNETYTDETLNFCLNDGGILTAMKDDSPPTVFMDQSRSTNPNWSGYQPPTYQNQQITQQQSYGMMGQSNLQSKGLDQTLPTISLILGILSLVLICCYGGFYLGIPAVIIGFIGMNNAKNNPEKYGGKGLAIGGLVTGTVSLIMIILFIIFGIFSNFL